MPDELPNATEQLTQTPDTGTLAADSGASEGVDKASEQGAATTQTQEDYFFDPASLPDELKPGWKQLQGSYTKKMQEISKDRQKIAAYDAFMANPMATLQQVANQYGLTISQARQAQQAAAAAPDTNWEPQTWDEVVNRTKEATKQEMLAELAPYLGNVQKMRASAIEQQLSTIDKDWRLYEEDMRLNLQKHPSLAEDPLMLYRISVPQEILEQRATQAAFKRFEAKSDGSRVSGKSQTPKAQHATPNLLGMSSAEAFTAAIEAAKAKLSKMGR